MVHYINKVIKNHIKNFVNLVKKHKRVRKNKIIQFKKKKLKEEKDLEFQKTLNIF